MLLIGLNNNKKHSLLNISMILGLRGLDFIFKRARPFLFCKGNFLWKILKSKGNFWRSTKVKTKVNRGNGPYVIPGLVYRTCLNIGRQAKYTVWNVETTPALFRANTSTKAIYTWLYLQVSYLSTPCKISNDIWNIPINVANEQCGTVGVNWTRMMYPSS